MIDETIAKRGRAAVAHLAHNQKCVGSNPTPAITRRARCQDKQ